MSHSTVFLLILGLVAMIKNGASIDCYDTRLAICLQSSLYADSVKDCMKEKENGNIYGTCPTSSKACLKLKAKFGSEEVVGKGCAEGKSTCDDIQKAFQANQIKSECDTCDSDYCNSDQKDEQNKMSSRSSSSCIHLSVFALFFILGAFFI